MGDTNTTYHVVKKTSTMNIVLLKEVTTEEYYPRYSGNSSWTDTLGWKLGHFQTNNNIGINYKLTA